MLAAIRGKRGHRLDTMAFHNGSHRNATLGGRELQIRDDEAGPLFVVEILHSPARGALGLDEANQTKQGGRQAHRSTTAWAERDRKKGPARRDWPRPRRSAPCAPAPAGSRPAHPRWSAL